ncbi:MAG: hypothetical protein ACU0BS_12995 [Hasllibacter sp.]
MRMTWGCIGAALICVWAMTAGAQDRGQGRGAQCAPRPAVLELLARRFGETRRGIGMHASGRVVEVFAAEAGTWSIVATDPNGVTCLIASGHGWEDLRDALPPGGEPA